MALVLCLSEFANSLQRSMYWLSDPVCKALIRDPRVFSPFPSLAIPALVCECYVRLMR